MEEEKTVGLVETGGCFTMLLKIQNIRQKI